jgi:hypothetical protein
MSEVILPSGMTGSVRKLTVKESKLFSDRAKAKDGSLFTSILKACWNSTSDWGPYTPLDSGSPNWLDVLTGDRFYAVLKVRCASFGSDYSFRVQCSDPTCRSPYDWSLNLDELEVKHLSEDSKAQFLSGNRFEVALPEDGRRVYFHLMTGADEERAAKMFKNSTGDPLFKALQFRITEIEDVEDKNRRKFIEEMSMSDAVALLQMMDDVDCGVETNIQVECPECYAVEDIRLPLNQEFFFPKLKTSSKAVSLPY